MNDKEKILEKIKKCFALSKSCNEHEAATALRQAQKLMDAYHIDMQEVNASKAEEKTTKSSATQKPSKWENSLAKTISCAFGCDYFLNSNSGEWCFVGCKPAPEICSYTFEVLLRKIKKSRQEFLKMIPHRFQRSRKTKHADFYCEGWVYSASKKVQPFPLNEEQKNAIDFYFAKNYPALTEVPTQKRTKNGLTQSDYNAYQLGMSDGNSVNIYHGMSQTQKSNAIEYNHI